MVPLGNSWGRASAVGAIVAGITADTLGIQAAIWLVAVVTGISGIIVAIRMSETLDKKI